MFLPLRVLESVDDLAFLLLTSQYLFYSCCNHLTHVRFVIPISLDQSRVPIGFERPGQWKEVFRP